MMGNDAARRFRFLAVLLVVGSIGAFLRLYLISDQILLDDEWHTLWSIPKEPLANLLWVSRDLPSYTPANVYAWVLLHTIGWSETTLRLLSLVPGLLALLILPLLVRRIHGKAVAGLFAVFLAFSPFLTFYSRIFRSYSGLVLFEFIAMYAAGIWLQTGKERFRWLYVFASAAALYFHPVAAIGVLAPWVVAGALEVYRKLVGPGAGVPDFRPGWRSVVLTAGLGVVLVVLTVQPTVIAGYVVPGSSPTLQTWKQFILMLFGTSNAVLASGLLSTCLLGVWTLWRKQMFWGSLYALVVFLNLLMIAVCHFEYIAVPIYLARYQAILFPLAHVGAAIGLGQVAIGMTGLAIFRKSLVRGLTAGLALLVFSLWILTNPLWPAYVEPNGFMDHSAFIESGQFGGWDRPYRSWIEPKLVSLGPPRISPFYRNLPARTRRLIEYPMFLVDHFNYYYFYQHLHGKQIVIGFMDVVDATPPSPSSFDVGPFINVALHDVDDRSALHFRNMVDVLDVEAVRRTRADYLICHKDLLREYLPGIESLANVPVPGLKECVEQSTKHFGPPVFEDATIIVFDVAGSSPVADSSGRGLASEIPNRP